MFPSGLPEVSVLSVFQRPPSDYITKVQNIFELRKHYSNKMHPFQLNFVKDTLPKNNIFVEKMTNPIVKKFCPKNDHESGHFRGSSEVTPRKLRTTSVKQKICTFADDFSYLFINPDGDRQQATHRKTLFFYGKR